MNFTRHAWFWLAVLAAFVLALYELGAVLTPFVAGMAVAYLLNPVVERLERKRLSRTMATVIVTLAFCLVVAAALVVVAPVLAGQVVGFARRLPQYAETLRGRLLPLIELAKEALPPGTIEKLQSAAMDYVAPAANWLAQVVLKVIGGGVVLVSLLSLAVITPIVAFYLLHDWPRIVAHVDSLLPRRHAATIREQVRLVDGRLAGFLRGQTTVCLILACFYGLGLSLVGLDFGLALGIITGLISFIPYVGMGLGLIVGVSLALVQFHSWQGVALVMAVFGAGQFIEGNFLTPRLVGERVGLHPAWIIFALLSGGSLFGFVGILLAVPVAAVIGVGVRFALARYLASPYYLGHDGGHDAGKGPGDGEGPRG
ncbi:MAG: AI-2E family transporter [Rhodospirillales bacterium]